MSDSGEIGIRFVDSQNVADFAPVKLVDDTPSGLVVTGVPEGVRIVVSGQDLIRNGETVSTVAATPQTLDGTATSN